MERDKDKGSERERGERERAKERERDRETFVKISERTLRYISENAHMRLHLLFAFNIPKITNAYNAL